MTPPWGAVLSVWGGSSLSWVVTSFTIDSVAGRRGPKVPILVISCFDGIGGCMRSYNICGIEPQLYVSIEVHKPAQRVTQRRWPSIVCAGDICEIGDEELRSWISQVGELEAIHLWGGFPCKDLSGAKYRRENLAGRHSSLFYQLKRLWADLKRLVPSKPVLFFGENVCSMDKAARDLISWELGLTPYRLDSEAPVPMSRPRYVWTNLELHDTGTIWCEEKEGFWQVHFECSPIVNSWLSQGWRQLEGPVVYPTCMRAIRRLQPPERPIGIHRCSHEVLSRWEKDEFRFPPYHYRDCYMVEHIETGALRYINADEQEVLLGYGPHHTVPALSASAAKQAGHGYEDERLSLLGDSFPANSFWVFPAFACEKWVGLREVERYRNRLGMWPGACVAIDFVCPIGGSSPFGSLEADRLFASGQEEGLVRQLARRVTHNGSDIRVSTGLPVNAKHYPRQSVPAAFWKWSVPWSRRWSRQEHINCLELRSILMSLLWRIDHLTISNLRLLHMSDSAVSISILSKGRTSAKALQHVVRRINSILLLFNAYLLCLHVDSMENPTDAASRG